MSRDRRLREALERLPVPDAEAAQERAWELVRAGYEQHEPSRRARRARGLVLAIAGAGAALAIGLSPAGARVGDLVAEVGEAVGIGAEDARPALRSLPAAGELLVESGQGVWVVREDGSKRLLGDYSNATWSPRGLFVATADGAQLVVVDPTGDVQWTIPTAGRPTDIRWAGSDSDTRIAYRASGDLYVVAGDGSGNRRLARDVAARPPAWMPLPGVTKVDPAAAGSFGHVLGYLDRNDELQVVAPDTGADVQLLGSQAAELESAVAQDVVASPTETAGATVTREGRRSRLELVEGARSRTVFSGPGRFTDPVWSPDGRWIVLGWRSADQWVFLQPQRPRRVVAIDRISQEFDPGGSGEAARFPRPGEWIMPLR
jgi:hypothetical protein